MKLAPRVCTSLHGENVSTSTVLFLCTDLDCATAREALPCIERDVLTLASRLMNETKTTKG